MTEQEHEQLPEARRKAARAVDGVYEDEHIGDVARNAQQLKANGVAPDSLSASSAPARRSAPAHPHDRDAPCPPRPCECRRRQTRTSRTPSPSAFQKYLQNHHQSLPAFSSARRCALCISCKSCCGRLRQAAAEQHHPPGILPSKFRILHRSEAPFRHENHAIPFRLPTSAVSYMSLSRVRRLSTVS